MPKKYIVELTGPERERCLQVTSVGEHPARSIMHAQVLLKADSGPQGPGWTDEAISQAYGVSTVTVANIRKRMVTEGLEAALAHYRCSQPHPRRKLGGREEAYLIALACSAPPEGRVRWSLRLLANRMVELGHVEDLSYNTVRDVLKKTNCNLGAVSNGASRPRKTRAL